MPLVSPDNWQFDIDFVGGGPAAPRQFLTLGTNIAATDGPSMDSMDVDDCISHGNYAFFYSPPVYVPRHCLVVDIKSPITSGIKTWPIDNVRRDGRNRITWDSTRIPFGYNFYLIDNYNTSKIINMRLSSDYSFNTAGGVQKFYIQVSRGPSDWRVILDASEPTMNLAFGSSASATDLWDTNVDFSSLTTSSVETTNLVSWFISNMRSSGTSSGTVGSPSADTAGRTLSSFAVQDLRAPLLDYEVWKINLNSRARRDVDITFAWNSEDIPKDIDVYLIYRNDIINMKTSGGVPGRYVVSDRTDRGYPNADNIYIQASYKSRLDILDGNWRSAIGFTDDYNVTKNLVFGFNALATNAPDFISSALARYETNIDVWNVVPGVTTTTPSSASLSLAYFFDSADPVAPKLIEDLRASLDPTFGAKWKGKFNHNGNFVASWDSSVFPSGLNVGLSFGGIAVDMKSVNIYTFNVTDFNSQIFDINVSRP